MITLKTSSYDKYDIGEFIFRLNGDADSIVSFYINVITGILQIVIDIANFLYFVFKISWHLTSVTVFYIPTSWLIIFLTRRYFKDLAEKRKIFSD